ncbi:carboxymuconolactone decarboxylase [Sphaerisporangium melleum]|uniref:Carboxymuconolactone decarboxylase n=1 Tax=Sphaerisporangium melleum TaxID=321316 RepID=A0A917QYJ6_9ACTN|nr:carboxymuconolactone decarboxylase family protein [Sphaerisporangium melleum]GGK76141.1 carboxymuconolactone decarboxylase [Sphaerisporangium melleum]GII72716.1 carboxymuconolactone decarboxylase [Sphaerisporangium melleum]
MPHIELGNDAPGIVGLMKYRPDTAKVLNELAEILLRGENTLSRGERELIAAYVSDLNRCRFCHNSHAAFAAAQLEGGLDIVLDTCADLDTAPVSAKMKALLRIAGAVQRIGTDVTDEHVAAAREAGATDLEIHDTVLIAAAFCMYNRYVDGLATFAPEDRDAYKEMAELIVDRGYGASLAEQH